MVTSVSRQFRNALPEDIRKNVLGVYYNVFEPYVEYGKDVGEKGYISGDDIIKIAIPHMVWKAGTEAAAAYFVMHLP